MLTTTTTTTFSTASSLLFKPFNRLIASTSHTHSLVNRRYIGLAEILSYDELLIFFRLREKCVCGWVECFLACVILLFIRLLFSCFINLHWRLCLTGLHILGGGHIFFNLSAPEPRRRRWNLLCGYVCLVLLHLHWTYIINWAKRQFQSGSAGRRKHFCRNLLCLSSFLWKLNNISRL